MTKKAHEIKIVSRSRRTGEEIVNVSSEYIARAVYGDDLIDAVIARGKIESIPLKRENAGK